MTRDLIRGSVVGALTAGIVMISTSALAGTGVGGVLNLGEKNAVDHGTTLTGTTTSAQLAVKNRGSGPALKLSARSGHPVLSVGNHVMVPGLNAALVGGQPASALVQQCAPGSVAAVGVFYAPAIPADPTYVAPNRYGGEGGYVCSGGQLQLTKEGPGFYRMKLSAPLPASNDYVLFVNPDARSETPLYADGNSEFAGPAWDIHVFDKNGNPAEPYYLDVQLVAD